MNVRRIVCGLVLLVGLQGCGGGSDDSPPPPAPNIDADGGSVSSADGKAVLTVPAGAASAAAHVTIAAVANPALPADAAIVPGTVFQIDGDGGALAADATLQIAAANAFPAGLPRGAAGRKQALPYGGSAPEPSQEYIPCDNDVDGDGDIDYDDVVLHVLQGNSCYAQPELVDLTGGVLKKLAPCGTPNGTTTLCPLRDLRPKLIGILFDAVAPTVAVESVDFPIQPEAITAAGDYTIRVSASDNKGVARVDFYLAKPQGMLLVAHQFGSVTTPPYQASFTIAAGDAGSMLVFGEAVDTNGNRTSAGAHIKVQIAATPTPDTTPPTVSLVASSSSAQVGQTVTLTANALDDVGVAVVEFFDGTTKIGEDTSAPYTLQTAAYVVGDIGTQSYSAHAMDAAGNGKSSAAVTVVVTSATAEAFVNATSGSDAAAGTAAAPFKTLQKAFTQVGAGGTVWLQNGVFSAAGEGLTGMDVFTGRSVPAGVAIRAVNELGPTIAFTLNVPDGGSIDGVSFDASSSGRVLAGGGTLTLSRPQWVKLGANLIEHGIVASGNAKVFLDPKGQASHNYVAGGLSGFASAKDTSELHVAGGRVEGSTGQASGAFVLDDTAKLVLTNVAIVNDGHWVGGHGAIYAGGTGNRVELTGVTIDLADSVTACILQDRQVAGTVGLGMQIVVLDSVLTRCGGGGLQLREGTPQLLLQNTQLTDNGFFGLWVGQIGSDSTIGQYARPEVSIFNATFSGNFYGSIQMTHGGTLGIIDSSLTSTSASSRGIHLANTDKAYALALRDSTVSAGIDALWLQGDATSVFVLGTTASGGNNTLLGGTGTGMRMGVAAGVSVNAVGNTWKANVQGANAAGQYTTAASVCNGADPCDVSSGSGANYTFTNAGAGATLRLAGNN
jgi:hypothetical protein